MDTLPDGLGMYLMMIFLAIAVIGMIMAVKNRVAYNKLADLAKDDKLRDRLDDIKKTRMQPQDLPKGWENTTIDLGKAKTKWEKYKPKESIDELMDKLKEDKKDD